MSVVLVDSEGGRSIVTYRGVGGEIRSRGIDWETVGKADWIQVSSLGGDVGLLEDIVNFAKINGIRVGVNPGGKELKERERIEKMIPKIDFLSLNRMEASLLLGKGFDNEEEIIKGIRDLGAGVSCVTDGKRGANLVRGERWLKMKAFPNKSVDDTGAGDAFVAGVVKGLLEGFRDIDCLKLGLANGASVVGKMGAKEGLLRDFEINKQLKRKLVVVEREIGED